MEGFVREEGKSIGFLGVFGHAEARGWRYFDAREESCELREDEWIVGTAAGNDELRDFCAWQDEAVQGVPDGQGGEQRGGADQVVGLGAMAAAQRENAFHVGLSVVFAAGAFGRSESQVRIAHEVVEKSGKCTAVHCEAGVLVEAPAAVGEMLNEGIDEHVARASVECEYLRRFATGRKNGHIADASKVERNAAQFAVTIEKVVGIGNERRALAAESHVGKAKIADGGDARKGGDGRGITDLQSGGGRCAEEGNRLALMKDGLTVAADECDVSR
jgi:hypothetical protein